MRGNNLPEAALDKLAGTPARFFPSDQDWIRRLSELGLTELTITPDPGRAGCEGALREGRRLGDLVIVSDGAGQSRVGKTGYAALDSLLRRLLRLEDRLIRVLERPEIPLHTNASENDIRGFVTKRKISGATVSEKGRQARDVMLGLAKTCAKLKIPLFDYLGARLGIPGSQIPNPKSRKPRPGSASVYST